MDPVTHTLVGVGMARAFFHRKVGPESAVVLALASNVTDIDVLVHLTADPAAITLRRTFGHSVFALPFWSLALAGLLKLKYTRQSLATLFALSLLGAGVHVFFDLINSFGVDVLWPLIPWRPELAIVFIIDLMLFGLLAAPWLVCQPRAMRPHLERACRISLALVALYVLFCFANRELAKRTLARQDQGAPADFSYVFPEPLGPHRWRGVLRENGLYKVFMIYSLENRAELKAEIATAHGQAPVEALRRTPQGRRLEAFFKAPVWEAQGDGSARVYDLRFRSLVLSRRVPFDYLLKPLPGGAAELKPASARL